MLVPVCLCKDRCGCDGCILAITFYYAGVLEIFVLGVCLPGDVSVACQPVRLELVAVDQQMFGSDIQRHHGAPHSAYRCIKYVDGVNVFRAHFHDSPCQRLTLDDRAKGLACLFGHFLGVVQQRMMKILRQDYCSSEYGSGQRTSSRLVATRLCQVCM